MRAPVGFAIVLGAGLLAAGCGTGGITKGGDKSAGKQLFLQNCGRCHTLADAGTSGTLGPNLDAAFAGSRSQGFKENTIEQVVRDQIELAIAPMPANLVTGADADAVAAYVASVAGVERGGTTALATTTTAPTTTGGGGSVAEGKSLYSSLGCIGCHSLDGSEGAGPTFKGLAGSQVKLSDGTTVTADDAYLLESILDPDKQLVSGYPKGLMSAQITPHSVSDANAKALIAFIKSL